MHPILFEIPGLGFPVRAFGLMVVLGFLLGSYLFGRLGQRHSRLEPSGLSGPALRDLQQTEAAGFASVPMWILVGILVGARAMYVIVEIFRKSETGQRYLDDPMTVFYYWEGGLVMYGGTFGGIALGLYAARKYRLWLPHALDLGLASGFVGLSVGRIGCLLVGDDFGKIVPESARDLPFPITVHVPEALPEGSLFGAENAGQVLWATQPWMSVNALLIGLLGIFLIKRRRYAGQVTLILLVLYSIGRFTIEKFRGDKIRGMWFDDSISTSQLVSLVLGSLSLVLLIAFAKRRDPERPTAG
ncbi:Prolipoprotein diacylglyceryl transferase [Planctomycetes bacterium Poly30]|uniref:Prolipoprotein diacylglyceryl transferase n=1 Tax=Saltatorellus ferox TaxID=2528018 RepID=A0A518EX24_9BACT|nr:Prolipoprotein diacylglyceryl transferase [Planctomycetes bacterium Poly30]